MVTGISGRLAACWRIMTLDVCFMSPDLCFIVSACRAQAVLMASGMRPATLTAHMCSPCYAQGSDRAPFPDTPLSAIELDIWLAGARASACHWKRIIAVLTLLLSMPTV
jgi:hypothetical protein